jgi:MFS superfamily sulfate permease-like transporter
LDGVISPRFDAVWTWLGVKFSILFALIGSLESILSAKAVDLLDPYKRETDMNRDTVAVGVGNTVTSLLGGLPMISEIVRSSTNIASGAKTRFANAFHGLCLLVFVVCAPWLLRQLPLAALAALLIYTGLRLASPRELVHAYEVGPEQVLVFAVTLLVTLTTDLLLGVAAGVLAKVFIQLVLGASLGTLLRAKVALTWDDAQAPTLRVEGAATFTNWLSLKRHLQPLLASPRLTIDLSQAKLIDHTVMSRLRDLERAFARQGQSLILCGLERHRPLSKHPNAARLLPTP